MTTQEKTKRLSLAAVFCALAFLVTLVPAPKVAFLSFDVKDAVIATASLLLGPSVAISLSLSVPLLEFITVGTTGPWGLLMDVISTAAFSVTAAFIYKYRKSLLGALLALSVSAAVQVGAMMLANLIITPLYTGAPRSAVVSMLLPLLLPFNSVKSVFNASLVMLLYKPISEALRRAGFLSRKETAPAYRFGGRSLLVFLASFLVLLAAVLVLFFALGASFGEGS